MHNITVVLIIETWACRMYIEIEKLHGEKIKFLGPPARPTGLTISGRILSEVSIEAEYKRGGGLLDADPLVETLITVNAHGHRPEGILNIPGLLEALIPELHEHPMCPFCGAPAEILSEESISGEMEPYGVRCPLCFRDGYVSLDRWSMRHKVHSGKP